MATSSKPAAAVDPEVALAHRFPEVSFDYDEREVALYALGIGACDDDAVDGKELHFVYHRDGQPHIKVLPTFVSLFPNKNSNGLGFVDVPGLNFDASLLLHGQQYIEIYRPIPSSASVVNKVKVAGLHDKGKATILELETTTSLRESGEILCMNRSLRCPYYFTDHHNLQKSSAVILLCNAGVLSTCVVLEGFQTLHSHILMLLILLIKFIAFLFQIRHLLQYMTTKQSNLRHVTLFTCAVLQ
jgi:hypothetical protein